MPTYDIDIDESDEGAIFQPDTLNVAPGDAVYWRNNTSQIHQPAMKLHGGAVWNLVDEIPGTIDGGDPATSGIMSPPNKMVINYFCAKHPDDTCETGTINVE